MDTLESTFREERLNDVLIEARKNRGLELHDIAEMTHVRREYLVALEEGRFEDLPENIYAKNFLRLYAQAVGLDDAMVLERFNRERGIAPAPLSNQVGRVETSRIERKGVNSKEPRRFVIGAWVPTLLLIAAIVAAAVWVFNTYLFNPVNNTRSVSALPSLEAAAPVQPETSSSEPLAAEVITEPTAATNPSIPAIPSEVKFSLITNPPGAEVSIDNYAFPGKTPIFDAPVTSGVGRVLLIELEGYEPYQQTVDLLENERFIIDLTTARPLEATPATVPAEASSTVVSATTAAIAGQGQLAVRIEEETWFEAYQSTVRGEGDRLVYTTLAPGESLVFNLPVYIHVGNAGGVKLSMNGQDIGAMGSSGEVLGRAFGQPTPAASQPVSPPANAAPIPEGNGASQAEPAENPNEAPAENPGNN